MTYKFCDKCKRAISSSNFEKHYPVCDGKVVQHIVVPESLICSYCSKQLKNNWSYRSHFMYCPKNTNRKQSILNRRRSNPNKVIWNKGLTKDNNTSLASASRKMKLNPYRMIFTDAVRKKISQKAKELNYGGYKPNAGRSKKFHVLDSFGNDVCLQSSYEFACYNILSDLGIKWNRPRFLRYGTHKYFPDFYLKDYDIYLDPKNSYLIKVDKEKIQKVSLENRVKLFILSKQQITKEYISSLCPSLNVKPLLDKQQIEGSNPSGHTIPR